ncbi:trypsin-like peptidase domain-containing protein [Streptomyces luteolus]|uniref:Serine protease n=1 Tax=Streptomyces luteolus TaxID=3043615 RepID=A0ABT6SZF1_9ACTN|nr:trypsin-like peptidase domain-containing protein [Streptomyces sp. B-S-A12]MDI3420781.1 serine protease [Streptomyces sp. B-S-A12]
MAGQDSRSGCEQGLVRICDLAGRPRGAGFAADELGTVITSHEAVDGQDRLVLHAVDGRSWVVDAGQVVPLPEAGLALVRTQGLDVRPLPVTVRETVGTGAYVTIAAHGWRQARVLGSGARVTYATRDRRHLLPGALELAVGTEGSDALRAGGGAAGGPVVDAETGAVLAVLGTALLPEAYAFGEYGFGGAADAVMLRAPGFAVPLRRAAAADPGGPLAELLARNAATVPAYGADLNVAGVLQLTATSVGSDGPREEERIVERPDAEAEFTRFLAGPGPGLVPGPSVLALVGAPGSGRTTELAALARRRARGAEPAPTLWLRGAGLWADDASVADAVARALKDAGRIVAASGEGVRDGGRSGQERELGDISADRVTRLVRDAGVPLLVLLDSPEEMPPVLAHRLAEWTTGSAAWLRSTGSRLVVACRSEYWEQAGWLFPAGDLYGAGAGGAAVGRGVVGELGAAPSGPSAFAERAVWVDPSGAARAGVRGAGPVEGRGRTRRAGQATGLPPCVPLGPLDPAQAARAREGYGIPDGAVSDGDAGHPLALRLLAEVRAAVAGEPEGRPGREEILGAYLDLLCLRVAVRVAAPHRVRGTAVRRLAAQVAGRVHDAARRCLGPGQGELDRASFEAVFPWSSGFASAVLTEGLLVPAGGGYRFAHEELADWIQGAHLDLDGALHSLVHRWRGGGGDGDGRPLPVPRHRIGPVVEALLLLGRQQSSAQLGARLVELAEALDDVTDGTGAGAGAGVRARPRSLAGGRGGARATSRQRTDAGWWAVHLLSDVLLRVPDARPYLGVLRLLAERIARRGTTGEALCDGFEVFAPAFWRRLALPDADRMDLLRRLVVADPEPGTEGGGDRFLDAVGEWLRDAPGTVQPLLTLWFTDERALHAAPDATVARAAQALLHTHRHRSLDGLTEALADCSHRRGDELLAALAEEEPSAVCRAVDRWAHDARADRRVAAAACALRTAPYVRADADRALLRYAALALLARPADCALHGAALALLVRDPETRDRHLPLALRRFAAGDPQLPASALAVAVGTHPQAVLGAFRERLREPGPVSVDVLGALAEMPDLGLSGRIAELVREFLEVRPEGVEEVRRVLPELVPHRRMGAPS